MSTPVTPAEIEQIAEQCFFTKDDVGTLLRAIAERDAEISGLHDEIGSEEDELSGAEEEIGRLNNQLAPYLAALEAGRKDIPEEVSYISTTYLSGALGETGEEYTGPLLDYIESLQQTLAALRVACDHKQQVIEGMTEAARAVNGKLESWKARALAGEAMVQELKPGPRHYGDTTGCFVSSAADRRDEQKHPDSLLAGIVRDLSALESPWREIDVDDRNALTSKWRASLAQPQPTDGEQK